MVQQVDRATIANEMITDRFEMCRVHAPVDPERTQYHYHEDHEINCTLQGEGLFYLDGVEYELCPGTVLLIHSRHMHRICQQGEGVYERAYFHVAPAYLASHSTPLSDLESGFKRMGNPASRVLRMDPDELRGWVDGLGANPGEVFGGDVLHECRFLEFMVALDRLAAMDGDSGEENVAVARHSELTRRVMALVDDNLSGDLSLDAIALELFSNKFYLSREFKKDTGLTLHEFIMKKRLLAAKDMLRNGVPAQAVAARCGFKSYSHFLRSFKQEFSLTPKAFVTANERQQFVRFNGRTWDGTRPGDRVI